MSLSLPRATQRALFVASTLCALVVPGLARAGEEIFAVTVSNQLINFNSDSPWFYSSRPITGMSPGEQALGIDFRPAPPSGRLYVLGSTSRLYRIDDAFTGVAVPVGGTLSTPLNGTNFGFDFNPTVDRIRVISDAGQNMRLHPDLGTVAAVDSMLKFTLSDVNAAQTAMAGGAAYTNNMAGASSTMLYDIDAGLDILVTQAPPNNGRLNTVGSLGLNVSGVNGFDISGFTGVAYAIFDTGAPVSSLFTINLMTGSATLKGLLGCGEVVRGMSVLREVALPVKQTTWGAIKGLYQ